MDFEIKSPTVFKENMSRKLLLFSKLLSIVNVLNPLRTANHITHLLSLFSAFIR